MIKFHEFHSEYRKTSMARTGLGQRKLMSAKSYLIDLISMKKISHNSQAGGGYQFVVEFACLKWICPFSEKYVSTSWPHPGNWQNIFLHHVLCFIPLYLICNKNSSETTQRSRVFKGKYFLAYFDIQHEHIFKRSYIMHWPNLTGPPWELDFGLLTKVLFDIFHMIYCSSVCIQHFYWNIDNRHSYGIFKYLPFDPA